VAQAGRIPAKMTLTSIHFTFRDRKKILLLVVSIKQIVVKSNATQNTISGNFCLNLVATTDGTPNI
jgi:hypothetical protein